LASDCEASLPSMIGDRSRTERSVMNGILCQDRM
jgi:hypothetical protein